MRDAYLKKRKQVLDQLQTKLTSGLSEREARSRLVKYGRNVIVQDEKISKLEIFVRQFKSPLVYILLVAILVSFLIKHFIDAGVIFAIVILNSLFGYYQEFKAEKSLELLKKVGAPHAKVIRNGKTEIINAEDVVPGDVLVLETGDKIPADCRLIKIFNLQVNESILTGESSPVNKKIEVISKKVSLGDQLNIGFAGTVVTYGRGKAIVTSTGGETEFGKIAHSLAEIKSEETPLQRSLSFFSKKIGIIVLGIVFVLFFVGILRKIEFVQALMIAISLAVAAIPEGLPSVVTITLALGTQRMIKNNALIRKLSAVETLGSTTVICSDKTGTLTTGNMLVTNIYANNNLIGVSGDGYSTHGRFTIAGNNYDFKKIEKLLECSWLCNDSKLNGLIGDPTELALKVVSKKGNVNTEFYRIDEIPFDSGKKYMASLDQKGNKRVLHMKGATEVILSKCKYIQRERRDVLLTSTEIKKIEDMNHKMARKGLRVLAFAYSSEGKSKDLVFLGLMGMRDPPRKEAKKAINICKKAGIRIIMITGDHAVTAQTIGRDLGLDTEVMTGMELEKLSDSRLNHLVKQVSIFARVNPEHKVRILKSLQHNGEIVAMTGDGINDAPALKKANVGIAMGKTGTDVTREASDMILLDDSFHSIVLAVKEGRTIFDNIKKFVRFLLSANLGEIGVIAVALFAGFPLPLLPLQILWINLVTDGLPALALGADTSERGIMQRKPRNVKEGILHNSIGFLIISGIVGTIITLSMFFLGYYSSDIDTARTFALMTLIMFELFLVFSARSTEKGIIEEGLFNNKYLIGAVLVSIGLQFVLVYGLTEWFNLVFLSFSDWLKIFGISIFGVMIVEFGKKIFNGKLFN
jgi:Ca2+-transporting ATPase